MKTTRRTPASSAAARMAVPSTLTERISSRAPLMGRAAAAWTRIEAPATSSRARVADVAAKLVDPALEARLVQRRQVERADLVAVGDAGQVQAEEARTT